MKKLSRIFVFLLAALLLFSSCSSSGDLIAKVNGREIELDEFKTYYEYYAYFSGIDTSDSSSRESAEALAEDLLNALVINEVISEKAEEDGLYNLTEEEQKIVDANVRSTMASARAQFQSSIQSEYPNITDAELEMRVSAELLSNGYDESAIRTEQIESIVYEKVYEKYTGDIELTDEQIQNAYDEAVESAKASYEELPSAYDSALSAGSTIYYVPQKTYRVKHILIGFSDEVRSELTSLSSEDDQTAYEKRLKEEQDKLLPDAQAVLDSVAADGSNFDEVMSEKSTDPGLSENPDGYIVSENSAMYDEDFVKGAFALQTVGEISPLVPSAFGYHIIKLEEITGIGPVPLEDVRESLVSTTLETAKSDAFTKLIEEWKKAMTIETFPNVYQKYLDELYAAGTSSGESDGLNPEDILS